MEAKEVTDSETLDSEVHESSRQTIGHQNSLEVEGEDGNEKEELRETSIDQKDIVRALEVVERDSLAIAQSFTSLFASLRLTLSEATSTTVDHMSCFGDAAGRLQECALDAATKGNRYINSCLRLNDEMKSIDTLATQLKVLRRNVDALDSVVNRLLRPP